MCTMYTYMRMRVCVILEPYHWVVLNHRVIKVLRKKWSSGISLTFLPISPPLHQPSKIQEFEKHPIIVTCTPTLLCKGTLS